MSSHDTSQSGCRPIILRLIDLLSISFIYQLFCFLSYSPVFEGIFDFCSLYTGASLDSAWKLNNEVSRYTYTIPGHSLKCISVLKCSLIRELIFVIET